MTLTAPELVHVLLHGAIKFVPAKPFTSKGFYGDLVLLTDCGNVIITGDARDMKDKGEAFFLTLYEFDQKSYWVDKETGLPSWPPSKDRTWNAVDLAEEWRGTAAAQLLNQARIVKFYRDVEDQERGLQPVGPLRSAAAIRLQPVDSPKGELVVFATPAYPFGVEVSTDRNRCQEILSRLAEFQPF